MPRAMKTPESAATPHSAPPGDVDAPDPEALPQSREWLVTALQSIGDAVIATDAAGRVAFMNPVAEALTGWRENEARGRDLGEVFHIIHGDTREAMESPVARVLRGGETTGLSPHALLVARDGRETPIDDSSAPIRGDGGAIVGVVLVFRDVAERRKSEMALQQSEERYRSLVTASSQIIWTRPPDGVVTDMPMWREYTGQSREEVRGWGWMDAIHPDDREATRRDWSQAVATKASSYKTEYRLRRRDGIYRYFVVRAVPVLKANGEIQEWLGACTDITEHKQAEERLRQSEMRKSAIFEAALDCIISMDDAGRIIEFNPAAEKTFGIRREAAIGRQLADVIIPPAYHERHFSGLARYLATGEGPLLNSRVEVPALRADGAEFPVELAIAPIHLGERVEFTGYLRDITEHKQAEERRRATTEGLRAVLEVADELLACPDVDTLVRQAVEKARERLGIERCAIFLAADDGAMRGTYGTDMQGRTTDERSVRFAQPDWSQWWQIPEGAPEQATAEQRQAGVRWKITENGKIYEWNGQVIDAVGRGWSVTTLIQSLRGPVGMFSNDAARSGAAFDPDKQEIVAVYCSLLGNLIEKKRGEESLRASEERFAAFMDNSPAIAFMKDEAGRYVYLNKAVGELVDASVDELLGHTNFDRLPEAIARELREHDLQVMSSGKPHEFIEVVPGSDGREHHLLTTKFPLTAANGQRLLAGVAVDVSERKRIERELVAALATQKRTAAELSSIIGQIADGVIITDPQGNITFVNGVARRLHGVADLNVGVDGYAQAYHLLTMEGAPYPPHELPLSRAVLHGETVIGAEWRIRRPDGTEIIAQGDATPVTGEDGARLGCVLTMRDVTEQREMMRELMRVNQMKDEFLAILSHELRTPLTPILGWASLLQQHGARDPDIFEQAVSAIQRNAELQKRLVNDLLDTTRIMSGKLLIEKRSTDLNEMIAVMAESTRRAATERGIRIETELDSALPPLQIDAARIQQVLLNLLNNAVKFSPDGGLITIRTTLIAPEAGPPEAGQGEPARTRRAQIEMVDSGEGIAPDVLPHVFELFQQGDSSYTRQHGGLGLGLAISKSLVEMHGGTVAAQSPGPGQGARFVVTLPVAQVAQVAQRDQPSPLPRSA